MGHSLPVDQADAVTRRISGDIAVNAAEDTRRLACGRPCCLKARPLCSDQQRSDQSMCAALRNVALNSSCPALTKPTAVRSFHLLQQPSCELAITLDPQPLALLSTRNRPRTAVRQGASWPAAAHLQLTAAAVVRPVLVVLCAELSWVVARPDGACPGGASSRHPAVGRRRRDRHRQDASHGVGRRSASSMRCPPHPVSSSGIQRWPSGVQLSGVRPSGSSSGDPAVRCPPSGVRPSAVRPRLVRTRPAGPT
jgi:hypothetical protein